MELRPNDTVDRYTVEAKLGEGGLAVVYKVRHDRLGTHHAMKVLKVATKSIQERLLLEGRVQARLNHPNVVSVTDIIEVADSPGLVMEFVEGASLDELITQERLDFAQIDELARGIMRGVGSAHAAGLIHRDLKPANILLEIRNNRFVPKVTDFGLAKMLASDNAGSATQTRTGMAMGTPSYMAPEQIESAKDVDARADVYSVGAILYELISGHRAYDDPSMLKIFNAVVNADRVPLSTHRPEAPERWLLAVNAAMSVDRTLRPGTCEELLALWTGEVHLPPADDPSAWAAGMMERARTRGSGSGAGPSPSVAPLTTPLPSEPEVSASPVRPRRAVSPATTGSDPPVRTGIAIGGVLFAGFAALMLGTVVSAGLALWWTSRADTVPDPVPVEVPSPVQPAVPSPTVPSPTVPSPTVPSPTVPAPTPAVVPEPTPTPVPSPAPVVPPTPPRPVPVPAPAVPTPAPPTPAPPTPAPPTPRAELVQVRVTGDATRIKLVRGNERFDAPGAVPPGDYRIEASFPGTSFADVGGLVVRSGQTVTLDCDGAFVLCQAR